MTAETTFADRHIGPSPDEHARMLETVGFSDIDALIDAAVPAVIRARRPLRLPPALSEPEALARLRELASRNQVLTSMIGLGYHGAITPGQTYWLGMRGPGGNPAPVTVFPLNVGTTIARAESASAISHAAFDIA